VENDGKFENTIEHDPNEPNRAGNVWSRRSIAIAVAAVAIVGAGVAFAQGGGWGPRFGPMGGGFAGHGLSRVLDNVDATSEQEDRIWKIIDDARAELRPIGRDFRDARDQAAEILGAATIDRAAAETLRAGRIAAIDQASRRVTAALLDAAEVLTPEQRTKLLEQLKERRGHRW